ncbi:hypothetical protein [Nocardia brasiliensis]|uniref:hypothetical protein n=1 Tax=Nocardia brasiliensis TaxID=37326 RepID=UPI001893C6CB|nr:hypothetical protein [Nocardia brasiliensis]MBF6124501.1 hypothetical protein [Nocardia brasiliensis]
MTTESPGAVQTLPPQRLPTTRLAVVVGALGVVFGDIGTSRRPRHRPPAALLRRLRAQRAARSFVGSGGGAITWSGDQKFGTHDGGSMAGG